MHETIVPWSCWYLATVMLPSTCWLFRAAVLPGAGTAYRHESSQPGEYGDHILV